jgi:hypothetical protein
LFVVTLIIFANVVVAADVAVVAACHFQPTLVLN